MDWPIQPAVRALGVVISVVCASTVNAAAPDDACALLTQSQVSAALGSPVVAGTYVTPTFKKTCTWTATDGGGSITLNLQPGDHFEGAKQMAQMAAHGQAQVLPVVSLGDDAYYFGAGSLISLLVKKGTVAFKVAVYMHNMPAARQQAIEKALALQVVSRL